MFYQVQAFAISDKYTDDSNTIYDVGELSQLGKSYARQPYTLDRVESPGYRVIVFNETYEQGTGDVSSITSHNTKDYKAKMLDMVTAVFNFNNKKTSDSQFKAYCSANAIGGGMTGTQLALASSNIPQWVSGSWQVGQDTVKFKVWFSDAAFIDQYNEREIRVGKVTDNVNNFYSDFATVGPLVGSVNYMTITNEHNRIAENIPPSFVDVVNLNWVDKNNKGYTAVVPFPIVVYGTKKDKRPHALQAIGKYLVANSNMTLEEWAEYFPELITTDKFLIVPLWKRTSMDTGNAQYSFYNPCMRTSDIKDTLLKINPTFNNGHMEKNGVSVPIYYKGIGTVTLGEQDNFPTSANFLLAYPDYSLLGTNDSNLARLSARTQQMLADLELLIRLAEIDDGVSKVFSVLGNTVDNVKRVDYNGYKILERPSGSQLLRVVTRSSYLAKNK